MKNILYTKLIRPKSKDIVHRNKNIKDKLMSISENKLTIVKGGPAVGKSTLISSYIGEQNNYMWLSLDENSDDLSYFWTYLLNGLKENIEDLNFYIDIINPLVKREDIFELVSSLINELIYKEELFIVLDDFHYIENEFLLETIEYFICNSSYNIHFILISRREINIYLGDILMKGGIVDIGGEDFYLSLDETEEFIKNSSKKIISDELIKEIYLNTEGWIGAIKLLLTILDANKTIKNLPKNNKLFIDYMNKEIINSLSKEEIDFLVKTSPLNYIDPSIYEYIASKNGFEIIGKLIERNMLIITIDEDKKIFRYHNILRQYLIELFNKYPVKIKNEIIENLTRFLINEKNYDEAISIFINWNVYDKALKIIENNADKIVSIKVVNEFPLQYYRKSIDLTFISIFFNYLNLDYERCYTIINSLGNEINNECLKAVKIFDILAGNGSRSDLDTEFISEIDSNLNILTKIIYYLLYSYALCIRGEYIKALDMMNIIKRYNKELNNSYVDIICQYNKLGLLEEIGKLNQSEAGYGELCKLISNKNYRYCFEIFRNVGLPGIYIKKLEDQKAEDLLIEAVRILNEFNGRAAFGLIEKNIEYNLAEVKYIQGNIVECERLVNKIIQNCEDNSSYIEALVLKIILLSSENKIKEDEYNKFINLYEKIYMKSNYYSRIEITYGIVLYNLKRYKESLDVFNRVILICRKNGIGYSLVCCLLWKVILLNKLNSDNIKECINILKEAMFYSRDEDILFPYYNNRKYLKDIIRKFKLQLLNDHNNKEFIKKLINLMDIKDESEVLSPREIEVLESLIAGLSNKEIGEKLFISISTVKTHIINIYSKLGVKNRVEAVNEGRKLIY
ncbi:LuxR C-terminal-related transcriptional regulator [Clostridium saccharobutylicum]|uniref:HTH-type transcriptional regulator MalT n=1 Tax=Clostridium saccharobutylicum TaxID=169679 RepID=A0A1S8MP18_CLOSA|nr:LuxR C-terminal-related transcriptional regulator [Clostridium saccharobutylicum]OOM05939.1 HTH-type transcriptional regulator MalT [Clostridium saccharobutylicum]